MHCACGDCKPNLTMQPLKITDTGRDCCPPMSPTASPSLLPNCSGDHLRGCREPSTPTAPVSPRGRTVAAARTEQIIMGGDMAKKLLARTARWPTVKRIRLGGMVKRYHGSMALSSQEFNSPYLHFRSGFAFRVRELCQNLMSGPAISREKKALTPQWH